MADGQICEVGATTAPHNTDSWYMFEKMQLH